MAKLPWTLDEDAGGKVLRERMQAGRITREWDDLSNSQKRKWVEYAAAVLAVVRPSIPPTSPSRKSEAFKRKIAAIIKYRVDTDCGLKEAKDHVEANPHMYEVHHDWMD